MAPSTSYITIGTKYSYITIGTKYTLTNVSFFSSVEYEPSFDCETYRKLENATRWWPWNTCSFSSEIHYGALKLIPRSHPGPRTIKMIIWVLKLMPMSHLGPRTIKMII